MVDLSTAKCGCSPEGIPNTSEDSVKGALYLTISYYILLYLTISYYTILAIATLFNVAFHIFIAPCTCGPPGAFACLGGNNNDTFCGTSPRNMRQRYRGGFCEDLMYLIFEKLGGYYNNNNNNNNDNHHHHHHHHQNYYNGKKNTLEQS